MCGFVSFILILMLRLGSPRLSLIYNGPRQGLCEALQAGPATDIHSESYMVRCFDHSCLCLDSSIIDVAESGSRKVTSIAQREEYLRQVILSFLTAAFHDVFILWRICRRHRPRTKVRSMQNSITLRRPASDIASSHHSYPNAQSR